MLIDKILTWKYHIDYIASKISRVVGIIERLRHSISLNTLIEIDRSLIFPYTYCGITAWGRGAEVCLRKVFILQERALRLMFFAGNRSYMLFLCLSPLMFYPSICFILKQYVLLCTTYLPILRLRISVIFSPVHPMFIHIILDFLMLVTCVNESILSIRPNSLSIFEAKLSN